MTLCCKTITKKIFFILSHFLGEYVITSTTIYFQEKLINQEKLILVIGTDATGELRYLLMFVWKSK